MKVKLLATIQGLQGEPAEMVAAAAGRGCYSSTTSFELLRRLELEEAVRFIQRNAIETGHVSILDFLVFVLSVEGVNRRTSHQLVRHHVGITFLQQSQRYVAFEEGHFGFTTDAEWRNAGLLDDYLVHMEQTAPLYEKALTAGVPSEVARDVLPNAAKTNITMIVNGRELLHICQQRLCMRAQEEIRQLFWQVKAEVRTVSPDYASTLWPKCHRTHLGYCPEGVRKPDHPFCHRYPLKEEIFAAYDRSLAHS